MSKPVISDHALLRFLDRAGGMEIDALREQLAGSLARAHEAARSLTESDYLIRADGLLYVVRGDTVTTVLDDHQPSGHAQSLRRKRRRG